MIKKILKKKKKRYTKKYNKRMLKSKRKRKSKKLKKMKGGGPMDFFKKIKEFVSGPKNKIINAKEQAETTMQKTAEELKKHANDFSQTFGRNAASFLNGKNDKTKWNNMVEKINKSMVEAVEKYFEALVAESKSEKMCLCCKRPYDEEKSIADNNTGEETPIEDNNTGEETPIEDNNTGKGELNDSLKNFDFSNIQ